MTSGSREYRQLYVTLYVVCHAAHKCDLILMYHVGKPWHPPLRPSVSMARSSFQVAREELEIESTAHARRFAAAYVSLLKKKLHVFLMEESRHGSFCVHLQSPTSRLTFRQLFASGSESTRAKELVHPFLRHVQPG